MPTIQVEAEISASELLRAVEQLSQPELDSFVAHVLALRSQRAAPRLGEEETALLRKINQGLPKDLQHRFEELKRKRQEETLTPDEHTELVQITDQMEQQNVTRMQSLIQLAELRQTTLEHLMAQLGIHTPSVE